MTTDTSERGLEDLICASMTGRASLVTLPVEGSHFTAESYGGTGWLLSDARDYDREYCVTSPTPQRRCSSVILRVLCGKCF